MNTTDWILDIVLILVVFRQLRWSRIDAVFLLVPIGIVGFVAYKYLDPIPTGGNDLLVIGACAALGTVLGVAGGLTTHVRLGRGRGATTGEGAGAGEGEAGRMYVRAGFAAATLWVLGMGARLAFSVWAQDDGGPTLVRFSERHDITSVQAWVSGLILMVLCEVGTRIGTILIRAARVRRDAARNEAVTGTISERAVGAGAGAGA